MSTLPLAVFNLGMPELIIIAIIGLLLFGKRLPEIGKSLGKSVVEFKKGLSGVEEEVNKSAATTPAANQQQVAQQQPQQQQPHVTAQINQNTPHQA